MAVIFKSIKIWILISIVLFGAVSICIAQEDKSGITPHQREQLKNLAVETKRKTINERNDLRHARMELYEVYKSYNIDENKAKAALARISSAQSNLLNMHLQNQVLLRQILNEDQFDYLKRRIQQFRGHATSNMPSRTEQFQEILPDIKMIENTGVSPKQLKKASIILRENRKEKNVIGRLRRDSMKLMGLYSKYDLNTQAAKKLIRSIHDSQSDLADLNHKKQQAFRKILTEPQFVQVRDQVIKKMREKVPHRRSTRG